MNRSAQNDNENDFWDELCGTIAFKNLGYTEINEESIKGFDDWYLNEMYPYLKNYLDLNDLKNKRVLEIGLGFGTVGQQLFLSGCEYYGLDYATKPVEMMNSRIENCNKQSTAQAQRGDAKELPFQDNFFDAVYSIGCLHHTGNLKKCIDEVYRVLKPGGKTMIMLYNKESFRQAFQIPVRYGILTLKNMFRPPLSYAEFSRAQYDQDTEENIAPVTEYVGRKDIIELFSSYEDVKYSTENFDNIKLLPRIPVANLERKMFLNNLAKKWGVDYYITARK